MGCGSSTNHKPEKSHSKFFIARDYTEIEGRFSGEGVKQTKAWEATITPTILNQKRQEFWVNLQGHNQHSCLLLKQAVDADAASAKLLLEMGGFVLENGTMSVCISPNGHRYELPPFMLADPVKFKDPNQISVVRKVLDEGDIKIKLRTLFTVQEDEIVIKNTQTVKSLKSLYLERHQEMEAVQFFFGGKLLDDNQTLISYSIESGMVIQVNKKKVI
jgi:hypothetical protein